MTHWKAAAPRKVIGRPLVFPSPSVRDDPIFQAIPDEQVRNRLLAQFDLDRTAPEWALAYRFDIVLRGRQATPLDEDEH